MPAAGRNKQWPSAWREAVFAKRRCGAILLHGNTRETRNGIFPDRRHPRRGSDHRADQRPALDLARNGAGARAQLGTIDRLYRRNRQARFGPWRERPARAGAGRARRRARRRRDNVGARRAGGRLAGRELSARSRARGRRTDAPGARLGTRHLRLRPLPRQARERRGAGVARGCRSRPGRTARACGVSRPRPYQHAGRRSRPRGIGAGGGARRRGGRRLSSGHRRRRSARRKLPHHPRRRPRQHTSAAAGRYRLGRAGGAQADPGRQGRVLRHRRPRPQTRFRHAADEKGHGGGGDRARARAGDHGRQAAGAVAGVAALRRELGVGQCDAADGHYSHAQGADRRDRQHRCRGPADPVRRTGRGLDRDARIC